MAWVQAYFRTFVETDPGWVSLWACGLYFPRSPLQSLTNAVKSRK